MGTLTDITRDNGLLTDGDWVESKTALTEAKDGSFLLITYDELIKKT